MGSYLSAVWRCRYFWLSLVKIDLRTRYQRSVLGLGWSLLHPLAMTVVIVVIFRHFLPGGADPREFPVYVLAGLACWNYLVHVTTQGCRCFHQGETYIRQYPAPMVIYPLRIALGSLIHFLIALVVVTALSWCMLGFANWWALPSLAPAVLLLFLLGWSLAVLSGFANVYFHDTQHLCEVGFQILFYATPIVWTPNVFGDGRLATLLKFHPFVPFLELFRQPILKGHGAGMGNYGIATLIVLAVGSLAVAVLARLQKVIIFRL
jgi:ABC-type polysaccharide/polyol phosphate export permease